MAIDKKKVKDLESRLDNMRAARDEIAQVSDKWANRAISAEAALRDLIAAAEPAIERFGWCTIIVRGKEIKIPQEIRYEIKAIADAVAKAKEVLK